MMFRKQEDPSNNALHTAILNRDNKTALELIPVIPKSELNHRSLGNTPLMLALKTANFEVARALLKRNDIEVVPNPYRDCASDSRRISPLTLACAWRETDIINSILEKYKAHIVHTLEADFDISELFKMDNESASSSFAIQLGFSKDKFPGADPNRWKMIEKRSDSKIYCGEISPKEMDRDIQSREYNIKIVDCPGLIIHVAPELTDALLFHSKLICLNLGLLKEDDFESFPSSQRQFAHDLSKGMAIILEYRNKKPVDEKIAAILDTTQPSAEATPTRKPH